MLTKASKAANLIDLQIEIAQERTGQKEEDVEMKNISKQYVNDNEMWASITDEVGKAFEGLLK